MNDLFSGYFFYMPFSRRNFLVSTVNIFMPCFYCLSIDRSNRAIFTQFSRNLCFSLEQHVNTRTGQEQSHCPTGTRHFAHLASFVRHPFRINLSRRYFAPKCFPSRRPQFISTRFSAFLRTGEIFWKMTATADALRLLKETKKPSKNYVLK